MPRAEGDGGGVAAGGANADKPSTEQAGLGGCWLGNAARTVTGPQGTNYVILGGTRYGLRLSQDSSMPATSREESLERRRPSSSRLEAKQQQLELTADCCCISRPRLLPLGSRIPLSWTGSSGGGGGGGGGGGASARQPATTNNSRACWPPSLTDGPQQQPVGQGAPLEQSGSHWTATKHRSLRLQEPAVTAVDRLQRFRWSGGSGGSGGGSGSGGSKKSSSSSGRSSDKAERLRELTEKLKGPAPVPPPRRPSRVLASSPPPGELSPPQQSQPERREEGRSGCRSYTFSESSSSKPTRQLGRSESLGEEGYAEQVDQRQVGPAKHPVDGGEDRDALGLMEPRPSSLYPASSRSSTQPPYRSASFGQADLTGHGESNGQLIANARRAAFAASAAAEKEARASTLPRARRLQDEPAAASPATPSPADSAVGSSAEGLVVAGAAQPAQPAQPARRPRSDGSDSLATSSPLASPSPPSPDEAGPAAPPEPLLLPDRCIEPHEVIITPPQEDYHQDEEQEQQRLSAASDAPSEASLVSEVSVVAAAAAAAAPPGKLRRYRGDTSKRRKGVYITQWPEPAEPELRAAAAPVDRKLSTQSSEERDEDRAPSATPSDLSDCEGHTPKRYSKRPLRGPYGQMLEAEMAKPRVTDLVALDDDLRPRRKVSANLSFNASRSTSSDAPPTPCHHRTTSSPSKLEGLPEPSPELLAELLRGSSERVARPPAKKKDTRTHIVGELYETESSYVEALHTLVNEYLVQLKKPENAHVVDAATVDEIFYQVPAILRHHEVFLQEIRKRIQTWDLEQTVGDVFSKVFTKPEVLETYTLFLDNWKTAKKSIKTCMSKPAFVKFLETMERGHRGKLGLDQLLIKPVQKFPRYELLIQRLLKHTDIAHEDHQLLTTALREIHELVVKINCHERESFEWEQQQSTLREVELLVEGIGGIVTNDRAFIRHDVVSIASNSGTRKERGLFLFSDLLVITSIKRRSGTIRKPSTSSCPNSLAGLVEANKYKMLMRIPLDDLEVMKAKDENLRRMAREVDHLREDCATLGNLQELSTKLHGAKQQLDELIKEMLTLTQKQLADRNASHSQLACLELTLNTQAGMENISVMFTKPDKRASWEESFNDAKLKLAASTDRRPVPEYAGSLPIRKTRAGLQFTCAAPTLANGQGVRDVWVCNSDGYVGQVCVLSLSPEPPQVTSCNGVCNSRILCVAGIPACTSVSNSCPPVNSTFVNNKSGVGLSIQSTDSGNIHLDSSSSDDSDSDDIPCADTGSASLGGDGSSLDGGPTIDEDLNQPTMWLGTEDGCVHVYNCTDNIRIKKNKVKLQHSSAVHCIIYLDNKVFLSLANGDVTVYSRDHLGGWSTMDPTTLTVGTVASPVTKMLPVSGKLWCASHNSIKVLNTYSLEVEHCLVVASDGNRPITCMASSGGLGVWVSLHNSAVLKLFHAASYECLADVNIAPAVTSMLANCDDIIRQHKAACLRVTALLACNELLWIGTSAGVLLTVPIPHIKPSTQRMSQAPIVTGVQYGHTGHVRFLTSVELSSPPKSEARPKTTRYSLKGSKSLMVQQSSTGSTGSNGSCGPERPRLLVISGGDGCEDFRGHPASAELQAGRDDSTNHLLLWKV